MEVIVSSKVVFTRQQKGYGWVAFFLSFVFYFEIEFRSKVGDFQILFLFCFVFGVNVIGIPLKFFYYFYDFLFFSD